MLDAIKHYFTHTVTDPDHWNVNWDALLDIETYEWKMGVTPLSQPIVPLTTVVAYLVIIFSLQVSFNGSNYNKITKLCFLICSF